MKKMPTVLQPAILATIIFISSCSSPAPYRDLNKSGKMDVYEDKTQPTEARIDDLLKQMNIEEKAGMLFINGARMDAVRNQLEDVPYDSKDPLYKFGFGLNY